MSSFKFMSNEKREKKEMIQKEVKVDSLQSYGFANPSEFNTFFYHFIFLRNQQRHSHFVFVQIVEILAKDKLMFHFIDSIFGDSIKLGLSVYETFTDGIHAGIYGLRNMSLEVRHIKFSRRYILNRPNELPLRFRVRRRRR